MVLAFATMCAYGCYGNHLFLVVPLLLLLLMMVVKASGGDRGGQTGPLAVCSDDTRHHSQHLPLPAIAYATHLYMLPLSVGREDVRGPLREATGRDVRAPIPRGYPLLGQRAGQLRRASCLGGAEGRDVTEPSVFSCKVSHIEPFLELSRKRACQGVGFPV